jgi:hypothetical protein
VDAAGWDLVKELNPQLARLKVLARSEPLLEGVIAMAAQPHVYRKEILASLLELHRTAAGQQLVTLFKTGPLMRARREDYDSVKTLLQRHSRLAARWEGTGERPGEPASWRGRQ